MVEDDLQGKRPLCGRRPLMEDHLQWKTTYGGRQPSVEDDLCWILACCLLRFAAFFYKNKVYKNVQVKIVIKTKNFGNHKSCLFLNLTFVLNKNSAADFTLLFLNWYKNGTKKYFHKKISWYLNLYCSKCAFFPNMNF